jgi:hypothetical protein
MKHVQHLLQSALTYWLYGSVLQASPKELLRRHNCVAVQPLVDCAAAFQDVGVPLSAEILQPSAHEIAVGQYAETLALLNQHWQRCLPRTTVAPAVIPEGNPYKAWLEGGGRDIRYRPVHALRRLVEQQGAVFFKRAIVHGSIATLDDTPGFSDMDLAFVVRASVLKDPDQMLRLRKLTAEILIFTYAFDPFMHHGPFYISEIDLAWYPEAMFPPVLFGYGVDLLDNSTAVEIWSRPSEDVTDRFLEMFEDFFRQWPSDPFVLKDGYDLEWLLGNAMILPALYLQSRTGSFRYKRDTFALAEKNFLPEEWEPIRTATELRANLGPRPKPGRLLLWTASQLRWPGLLQHWAKRQPGSVQRAVEAKEVLGEDYPQRVLRLLRVMKRKLG